MTATELVTTLRQWSDTVAGLVFHFDDQLQILWSEPNGIPAPLDDALLGRITRLLDSNGRPIGTVEVVAPIVEYQCFDETDVHAMKLVEERVRRWRKGEISRPEVISLRIKQLEK